MERENEFKGQETERRCKVLGARVKYVSEDLVEKELVRSESSWGGGGRSRKWLRWDEQGGTRKELG